MKHVEVNFKKLVPEAVTPRYAKAGDAGLDITAISVTETDMYIEYGTGLALEIPPGYYGDLRPRSSISNYDLVLANSCGTLDSGFRGEIKFRFKKVRSLNHFMEVKLRSMPEMPKYYQIGDRVGQLIVQEIPSVILTEVSELEDSDRGHGGFGSSGL